MNPLNSPVEVGIRALIVLRRLFPESVDIGQLVLLDYGLIHSGDLGGPSSVMPDTPARPAEIGVKRQSLTDGLQVMMRAGLVELVPTESGLEYRAGEGAGGFLSLLESSHVRLLQERAEWVTSSSAGILGIDNLSFRNLVSNWAEEFIELRTDDQRGGDSGRD
ncbi:ABC-three component system middle component 2 [Amycolatopsis sp. NPDC023774]|uniref:ABC-three component system middle component 2 n=1 Tax=Amycolatopsis sp. NPDC023774 TaxID=3155015 RepID=UPI0033F80334